MSFFASEFWSGAFWESFWGSASSISGGNYLFEIAAPVRRRLAAQQDDSNDAVVLHLIS
jgi:hypothetical protein